MKEQQKNKLSDGEIEINGAVYVRKDIQSKKPISKNGLEYCIIRTYSAGVFAGCFNRKTKGQEGRVFNARRLWYWDGANSLSQLAMDGVSKPQNCKFPIELPEIDLKNIIEVIPCTKKAQDSIKDVPIWEK